MASASSCQGFLFLVDTRKIRDIQITHTAHTTRVSSRYELLYCYPIEEETTRGEKKLSPSRDGNQRR